MATIHYYLTNFEIIIIIRGLAPRVFEFLLVQCRKFLRGVVRLCRCGGDADL